MAKLKIVAPFDSKLGVWMNPMVFAHVGQAERMWMELANDGQSMISKHPEDFNLFQLGEFDDASGQITPIHPPVHLFSSLQFKKRPAPTPLEAARSS